jgi:DUF1365 family protein
VRYRTVDHLEDQAMPAHEDDLADVQAALYRRVGLTTAKPPRALIIVGLVTLSVVLGLVWLCVAAWRQSEAVYAEFMSGCEQDHKHYGCMLLWRATRHDDPIVVPTPAYVPNSR